MELLLGLAIVAAFIYMGSRPKPRPPASTPPPKSPPAGTTTSKTAPPPRPEAPPPRPAPKVAPGPTTPRPSFRSEPLLTCLAFLRYEFGADWSGVVEPFSVDPKDAIDVNRAVNRLAAHAGLRGLRFIVGIGHLAPKHGGLIELQTDQEEVYIDVATAAGAFGPSLLAVLAHEISHKVLFDRRIHQVENDRLRYEILTDVTAVYLGFGKLLLNGYEYQTTRHDFAASTIERRRMRFGYVTVDEVAFVHAMASRMREVPGSDWLRGLSPFARRAMNRVVADEVVRQHLDTAPTLVPQRTYHRPPSPPRAAHQTTPRAASRQPGSGIPGAKVAEPGRPKASSQGMSPEVRRLRDRLLVLVYGDERVASRLVAHERSRQDTLAASYEAAIARLIRDRS